QLIVLHLAGRDAQQRNQAGARIEPLEVMANPEFGQVADPQRDHQLEFDRGRDHGHRASLSSAIRRSAAKLIISRRKLASELFSKSSQRAILSSVIVVVLKSELRVATQP